MNNQAKFKQRYLALAVCSALGASVLTACNSDNKVNVTPIPAPDPTPSLVQLSDNQVALYYKRDDGDYDGWGLHLWNGEGCGDYAAPTTEDERFNNWTNPYTADGIDATYGAYYVLSYTADSVDCLNFILHKGEDKALGSANKRFDLTQTNRHVFSFHGFSDLYYQPLTEVPVAIDGASAHWIDANTFVWDGVSSAASIELAASADATMTFDASNKSLANATLTALSASALSDAQKQQFPHLAQQSAFTMPTDVDMAAKKALLKGQLYALAKDADGDIMQITRVQIGGALDSLYTAGDNDANEAHLGSWVTEGNTQFSLWAPTAKSVKVHIFDAQKQPMAGSPFSMTEDANSGIFTLQQGMDLHGYFYQYEVEVYHPATNKIEMLTVTDPYSLSLSTNSTHSQVVDLQRTDTQPSDWSAQQRPAIAQPEDHIIYETHIRDFSAFERALSDEAYRGKYGAFMEADSYGVRQLKALKAAGLNTVHLLPTFDIATINEDAAQVVNIQDTLVRLCDVKPQTAVCASDADQSQTIESVLASYDPATGDAQTLVEALRSIDSYNWGYDPFHYTVPEGSYAVNPDGVARIVEFRQMVQSLHNMGFRVVMDVVYNHTNASGLGDKSVLDKVVPGYYHRLNPTTGEVEQSTCCDNTATERTMMAKLMTDSLVVWARDYAIDGFRFDLMGHQPKSAMLASREAVWAIDPDNYFYGEGWNFGEVVDDAQFIQATQVNMAGTSIGTFTDRLRDAVRGGGPFDGSNDLRANQGVATGIGVAMNDKAAQLDATAVRNEQLLSYDQTRVGLAANLEDFVLLDRTDATVRGKDVDYNGAPSGYAQDPADTINYVSKHDNQTLWDNLQYKAPHGATVTQRRRMQTLALAYPMLGQGIPFIHMGSELLRSKAFLRDSYDYGDWFNRVDFSQVDAAAPEQSITNNFNVGLPPAEKDGDNWSIVSEVLQQSAGQHTPSKADMQAANAQFLDLLRLRTSSPLFRLTTASDIQQRIDFRNVGSAQMDGLIVMTLHDGTGVADLDPAVDAIAVVFNNSLSTQSVQFAGSDALVLHSVQANGADEVVKAASVVDGVISVPALTAAVFVVPQGENQGAGLPVDTSNKDLSSIPPWGDIAVYLRGSMNGWSTDHQTQFESNGVYAISVALDAGDHEFKLASADWSAVNLGASHIDTSGSSLPVTANGDNLMLTLTEAGNYRFALDASDVSMITLNITKVD